MRKRTDEAYPSPPGGPRILDIMRAHEVWLWASLRLRPRWDRQCYPGRRGSPDPVFALAFVLQDRAGAFADGDAPIIELVESAAAHADVPGCPDRETVEAMWAGSPNAILCLATMAAEDCPALARDLLAVRRRVGADPGADRVAARISRAFASGWESADDDILPVPLHQARPFIGIACAAGREIVAAIAPRHADLEAPMRLCADAFRERARMNLSGELDLAPSRGRVIMASGLLTLTMRRRLWDACAEYRAARACAIDEADLLDPTVRRLWPIIEPLIPEIERRGIEPIDVLLAFLETDAARRSPPGTAI